MNCDKFNCEMRGRMVYCIDLQQERYHFTRCPFYNTNSNVKDDREKPMSEDLLDKCRKNGL